jgi:putative MATE family efflux protein
MRFSRAYLRTFVGSKSFYKGALAVMIPVVLQQLINTLFNVVDTVMVGSLGELAMSAVSVANKPGMIFNGCFFGLTGAGGLMLSQYYGAKDREQCQSLFSLEFVLGLFFATLYFVVLRFFPEWVMGIYVKDERTIAIGVSYLRTVSYSYLPAAISTTCIFSMRSLGHNKTPMAISLTALFMNALFNYVFMYGKLGFPAMGVEGAALGTLVSRMVEMCIYLIVLATRRSFFSLRLSALFSIRIGVLKGFIRRAIPLTANELLWSTGLNVFFWAYARLDEPSIPAMVIADQAFMVGFVLSTGISSAVSVLIGTELGAGNFKKARESCKQLLSLDCCIALACSVVGILCSFIMPYIIPVKQELRSLSTGLTMLYSLFYPVNCVYAFCFFCLRAGGDTKNAALLDSVYMWLLPVPVSVAMASLGVGSISLPAAIAVVQFLMNLKIVLALRIVKRGKWIRNITLEG